MNRVKAVAIILDTIRSNEAWEDFGFSGAPTPEAVEDPSMMEVVPLGTAIMKAMVAMHCAVLVRGGYIGRRDLPAVLEKVLWEPDVFISLQADPETPGSTEDVLVDLTERVDRYTRTSLRAWDACLAEHIGVDRLTDGVVSGRIREGIGHFVEVMRCMVVLLSARTTSTRRGA